MEVRPEILIARIAEVCPHSRPVVETFRHFANPETYKTDISDLGDDQIAFSVSGRPKGQLSKTMELLLSVDPNGPKTELWVSRREERSGRYPIMKYAVGWDMVTYDSQHPHDRVYKFLKHVQLGGGFDPISKEAVWFLQVMRYFNRVSARYFQGINPEPRVITFDQQEVEWAQASKRFLASIT